VKVLPQRPAEMKESGKSKTIEFGKNETIAWKEETKKCKE
jgi:hypothetical protein